MYTSVQVYTTERLYTGVRLSSGVRASTGGPGACPIDWPNRGKNFFRYIYCRRKGKKFSNNA